MRHTGEKSNSHPGADRPRYMSVADFTALGAEDVVYVRPIVYDGTAAFAIHSGDGQRMGVASDRATAFAMARQHDREALSVH